MRIMHFIGRATITNAHSIASKLDKVLLHHRRERKGQTSFNFHNRDGKNGDDQLSMNVIKERKRQQN
jgi:hypothetical protein